MSQDFKPEVIKKTPAEVLMEALEAVEGATEVVILIDKEEHLSVKTTCDSRRLLTELLNEAAILSMSTMYELHPNDED